MHYLLTFLVGFTCASPIGPMGLLCLRRTLTFGLRSNLRAVSGIAFADGAWAFITVNGMRPLSNWLAEQQKPLSIVVGVLFLYLGCQGMRDRQQAPELRGHKGALTGFIPNFSVVFFNPSTVILFSAVFALIGVQTVPSNLESSLCIALCVTAGVLSFWLILGIASAMLRESIQPCHLRLINRFISTAIAAIGACALIVACSPEV